MASDQKGKAFVIMGVSGAGKSTIGEMLAKVVKCDSLDADDFHPQSNKQKMHQGIPVSEEDRILWLEMLRDTLRGSVNGGKIAVLGCSALEKRYREILRSADSDYKPRNYYSLVKFTLLDVRVDILVAQLEERAAGGKHFMPATLLQSQLDLLHRRF